VRVRGKGRRAKKEKTSEEMAQMSGGKRPHKSEGKQWETFQRRGMFEKNGGGPGLSKTVFKGAHGLRTDFPSTKEEEVGFKKTTKKQIQPLKERKPSGKVAWGIFTGNFPLVTD